MGQLELTALLWAPGCSRARGSAPGSESLILNGRDCIYGAPPLFSFSPQCCYENQVRIWPCLGFSPLPLPLSRSRTQRSRVF